MGFGLGDGCVEDLKEVEAGAGDGAEDLAAVGGVALALDEAFLFEAVDEAGDAGGLFDHAVGDFENGEGLGLGAAEDAEDVELLEGDAVGFDDGVEEALGAVGGGEDGDDGGLGHGRILLGDNLLVK